MFRLQLFRSHRRKHSSRPTKIVVSKLTNNVAKDHVMEIFSTYGCIKSLELNSGKVIPGRPIYQIAFVEYDSPLDAGRAVKYMNGGRLEYCLHHSSSILNLPQINVEIVLNSFMAKRSTMNGCQRNVHDPEPNNST